MVKSSGPYPVKTRLERYTEPVYTFLSLDRFQKLYPDQDAVVISKNTLRDDNKIVMLSVDFIGEDILNSDADMDGEKLSFILARTIFDVTSHGKYSMFVEKYQSFDVFLQKLKTICVNCDYHKTAKIMTY